MLPAICVAQTFQETVTPAELALAPPYCPYTQSYSAHFNPGDFRQKKEYWTQVLGDDLNHLHHYCDAIIRRARADGHSLSPFERGSQLGQVVYEIDYVLRNTVPNFVLRPEFYTKKGEALMKLRRHKEAVEAYRRGAQARADYWPAYSGLAELLRANGNLDDARGVVEEGLRYSPTSKTLNTLLAELKKSGAKSPPPKPTESQNTEQPPNPEPAPQGDPGPQESPKAQDASPTK